MPHDLFIGGQLVSGQGPAIEIINPASGGIATSVASVSAAQLDEAVAAAAAG